MASRNTAEELLPLVYQELRKLEQHDSRKAELVRLRFFAGLTLAEAARALGISGWVFFFQISH